MQHTAPLEQVRLVQSEMKKLLEQSTLEAKYSIADAELIPSSDDDPDDSDKNPLFLNSRFYNACSRFFSDILKTENITR